MLHSISKSESQLEIIIMFSRKNVTHIKRILRKDLSKHIRIMRTLKYTDITWCYAHDKKTKWVTRE